MNTKDLEKLGLTKDVIEKAGLENNVIDQIMKLHSLDIEATKSGLDKSEEIKALQTQLDEANKQIDAFKEMDVDTIKKVAADWEQKAKEFQTQAEQAEKDANARVEKLKFDTALTDALRNAKAKDPKEVLPHLDMEIITFKDGKFTGLDDQLKPLQESKDYLFDSGEVTPKFVGQTKGSSRVLSSLEAAALKGAGLTEKDV